MKQSKRQRLEAKGWKITTVETLLDLTPEDVAAIEARLSEDTSGVSARKPSPPEETVLASESHVRELVAT